MGRDHPLSLVILIHWLVVGTTARLASYSLAGSLCISPASFMLGLIGLAIR